MFQILHHITPAEANLIINRRSTIFADLLKYTCMDLVVKQVLEVRVEQKQSSPRDPVRHLTYVYAGKNLSSYKPQLHERVILNPFYKNEGLEILLSHLARKSYDLAQGHDPDKYVHGRIMKVPSHRQWYSSGGFGSWFGGVGLSRKGKDTRKRAMEALASLPMQLPSLIDRDRDAAIELLKGIGGNIFLCSGIDYKQIQGMSHVAANHGLDADFFNIYSGTVRKAFRHAFPEMLGVDKSDSWLDYDTYFD